jgi:hypothetical protein
MKTLLATAFLLCASSLVTAHAEWEILDTGMPGSTAIVPSTTATTTAPTTASTVQLPAS